MERIRESFGRQGFMRTIGAVLESVESGTVAISCGFEEGLTQQHGLFHGGVLAASRQFPITNSKFQTQVTLSRRSRNASGTRNHLECRFAAIPNHQFQVPNASDTESTKPQRQWHSQSFGMPLRGNSQSPIPRSKRK